MGKGSVDGIDIVGNSAYDIAGGVGVKISDRKGVQLFKQLGCFDGARGGKGLLQGAQKIP